MVGEHLWADPQDGHVEPVVDEGVELRHAVHGVLDELHVRVCEGVGVGDEAAGRQLEDVGDAHAANTRGLLHPFGEGEQLAGVGEEDRPPRGEGHVAAVAGEEPEADLALELPDLARQRRLAHVEPGGRPAEVELVGDRDEVAHEAQVEVHPSSLARPPGAGGHRRGL